VTQINCGICTPFLKNCLEKIGYRDVYIGYFWGRGILASEGLKEK
jgi:hypothetical protein